MLTLIFVNFYSLLRKMNHYTEKFHSEKEKKITNFYKNSENDKKKLLEIQKF